MRDDLVAAKVEIDPMLSASSFGAAQKSAVEAAGRLEVIDGKGQMERLKDHSASMLPRPLPVHTFLADEQRLAHER